MWRRILALVHKEFLALLKDPKSRMVLIVPPIVQLLVFVISIIRIYFFMNNAYR